ncbi:MAG: GrpB family protein [Rubrivivax sp.]
MRTIEVVSFDESWTRQFETEAWLLEALLRGESRIHHIGSTSVPGLAAKPIVDILIEIDDVARLDAFGERFRSLGYEPRGENGIPGRRYFVKGSPERTHQIHAFTTGSHDALRHLAVRDYLRGHPDECQAYAQVKLKAAAVCGNDIHRYVALKSGFLSSLEMRALAEQARQVRL